MPAIEMVRKRDLTGFRKLSLGIWRTAYDPQIYGVRQVRMERALEYIEQFEKKYQRKLTVTHLMTKAVGVILHHHPEVNAVLRLGRIYLREHADICLNVAAPDAETGGTDILTTTVADADRKSLLEIAEEVERKAARIRSGGDRLQTDPGASGLRRVPGLLMAPLLWLLSLLHYGFNLDLSRFGFPRDPFGSAQLTSLGSLGVAEATILGPLVPFTRMPLLVLFGAIFEAPVVQEGEVVVGKVMNVTFTVDHRFTDGPDGMGALEMLNELMENPFEHFDPV